MPTENSTKAMRQDFEYAWGSEGTAMAPNARCRVYLKIPVEVGYSDSNKINVSRICQVSAVKSLASIMGRGPFPVTNWHEQSGVRDGAKQGRVDLQNRRACR